MSQHNESRAESSNTEEMASETTVSLPAFAEFVLEALENAGFESWAVGGCVRDALLGRPSNDIDIATSAPWRSVQRVFEEQDCHTHETGTAHGTLTVVVGNNIVEVTTFRTDGAYSDDARHPKQVSFVRTIEEDLARRDFTMNAMAYHPSRGLLDPYDGYADLKTHTIRTVGNPEQRFSEDALRILRACRFASQLGFSLDRDTFDGMLTSKGLLTRISTERVTHELSGLLLGEHAGYAIMETVDALAAVLPELVAMKGFEQRTPYHVYDVLEHTARTIDGTPSYPLVRWAALFHDMGKPASFFVDKKGTGHFYGHADISVRLARGIMTRLSLSPAFTERVLTLVKRHDDVIEPTPKAVKRVLARLDGDTELFKALCDLKRGDARGQAPSCIHRVALADELERTLANVLASDEAFSLKKLAIDGRDIIELGVSQGPRVGQALDAALEAVIDERIPNDKESLRSFTVKWISASSEMTRCNASTTEQ